MEKVERRWGTYTFYFFGSFFLSLCFLFGFWISNPLSNGFDNGVGDFGSRQPQGGRSAWRTSLLLLSFHYDSSISRNEWGINLWVKRRIPPPILHNVLSLFFLFSKGFCIPSTKTFLDFLFLSVFWNNREIIIWFDFWTKVFETIVHQNIFRFSFFIWFFLFLSVFFGTREKRFLNNYLETFMHPLVFRMGAEGPPNDQRFIQPINQIFFLFGSFFFLSVFWKNMQRNCFLFGFLIIIWIIIWKHLKQSLTKTFVQPINQNIFQIFFLFGSFFFSLCFFGRTCRETVFYSVF